MRMRKTVFGVLIVMVVGVTESFAVDQAICNPGSQVSLFPSGSLMSCVLKDDFSSNGIKCKELLRISFHDSGELDTCTLAERAHVGDQDCRALGSISF